jgi:hypothetical protein
MSVAFKSYRGLPGMGFRRSPKKQFPVIVERRLYICTVVYDYDYTEYTTLYY